MQFLRTAAVVILIPALLTIACRSQENTQPGETNIESMPDEEQAVLEFKMVVHRDVYEKTDFGEPPQIAIWLQRRGTDHIRTVWVARRAGRRLWKGKFECPTALPYWESRHQHERSDWRARGLLRRLVDAISGATPTGGVFTARVSIPKGSRWDAYIEVNASADFNADFPYWHEDGSPDHDVNGQPSLVYRGRVVALPDSNDALRLIGRTDQWIPVDYLIEDLTGITSAKDLITDITVVCVRFGT